VPESRSSSRNTPGTPVPPSFDDGGGRGAASGELRLRVLNSLPETHQRYLFEKMLSLCRSYLRTKRVPASEVSPKELLSEIWVKLLATVSLDDKAEEFTSVTDWSVDPAPERDGRVVWLIEEIGGFDAIRHRHEDLLRRLHGRFQHGRRPIKQLENEDEEIASDPDESSTLQQADVRRAWRGLLITANLQFQKHDDVSKLLHVMDDVRDLLEESSSQWPIKRMVDLLNESFPPPSWTGGRVDNAKRRLLNWINRLKQTNGFDTTDLQDLFARVARRNEKRRTRVPDGAASSQRELMF
jgi:hypothetical protein